MQATQGNKINKINEFVCNNANVTRADTCTRVYACVVQNVLKLDRPWSKQSFHAQSHDTHAKRYVQADDEEAETSIRNYNNGSVRMWLVATHLQCDSPRGDDTQSPPFLQGLGEHDTKPVTATKISVILCMAWQNIK